jgi:serine/threonine protein kinase
MTSPTHQSPWEPPSPEELHAMLPQYEITAILGRGGMGAVYKGRQTKLNRDVAIKLLPETLVQGEDEMNFAVRFEREAQAMANLDHPAIVSVYDFGETEAGQCYFVMEFVDGMDIHQYLRANDGRLLQEHAIAITSHVLDALDYAHSRGIVHRDIKPANVLLNQDGRVKIADFGLAKKMEDGTSDLPALTMSNVALGTPDFVAPESLDGSRTPDHRADLYAVGVMLYQMLTGSLPRGQFKTPSELRPEVDFRLDEIVNRAMQPDPTTAMGLLPRFVPLSIWSRAPP